MTADDGIARLDLARAKQRAHRNESNRAEPLELPPPNAPMAVARHLSPTCSSRTASRDTSVTQQGCASCYNWLATRIEKIAP